jgi:hypothetical protein
MIADLQEQLITSEATLRQRAEETNYFAQVLDRSKYCLIPLNPLHCFLFSSIIHFLRKYGRKYAWCGDDWAGA